MALKNPVSTNVKVFPFGANRVTDPNGNLLSEHNLTNIVKRLTDKPSYVLNYASDKLEFVLNGYYFELKGVDSMFSLSENIYAAIKIEGNGSYLYGGDELETIAVTKQGTTEPISIPSKKTIVFRYSSSHKDDIIITPAEGLSVSSNERAGVCEDSIANDSDSNASVSVTLSAESDHDSLNIVMYNLDGHFSGLSLFDNIEEEDITEDYFILHILTRESGTWKVPHDSWLKYNPESLHIDVIQCRV